MRFLWASSANDSTYVFIIIGIILLAIFALIFVINMVNAKFRVVFFIDDKDVMKLYVKYHTPVIIPDELKEIQWYKDPECTIPYEPTQKINRDEKIYSRTPNYKPTEK